jgi:hypothetical protein
MRQFYTFGLEGLETDLVELCRANNEDREIGLCKSIAEANGSRANLQ